MSLIQEKIKQTVGLLDELDIDLWLVFVRETPMMADPVLSLVVGQDVTWQSFFAYSRTGEAIALVGNFDVDIFTRSECFSEVLSYTQSVRDDIRALLARLDPQSIAVNYSKNDVAADGLTHGMYLLLQDYLDGTPYRDRVVSAEALCARLRSRKVTAEIGRLRQAAVVANTVWETALPEITTGMTEREIAALIKDHMERAGATPSFETIVNAGSKTNPGHGRPTDAVLDSGDLLHVDFGVRVEGYCSDLQRLAYFRRPEEQLPAGLDDAFSVVNEIITATAKLARPGVQGHEIDAAARTMLGEHGFPEYQHALGHQLGQSVHDGGAILGPKWPRYGVMPTVPLESGNVFTLELEIILPGVGCVGLEEDVLISERGAEFLCPRQLDLPVRS